MTKEHQISYPVCLTPPQLAFLLSVIKADRLWGLDQELLLPSDQIKQSELWQLGRQQLQDDGWLIVENGYHHLNEHLLLLVAALANPEIVLLTIKSVPGEDAQGATHYCSQTMFIEQTVNGDDNYELTALFSAEVMVNRLVNLFSLPKKKKGDVFFDITQSMAKEITPYSDEKYLVERGVPERGARLYLETLQRLTCKGAVKIIRLRPNQELLQYQLGILVSAEKIAWLATAKDDAQTRYELIDSASFQEVLLQYTRR